MPDTPRDEEMLGEIAELELALAKEAFRRAQAAEAVAEFEAYSKCFQRLTRACRLSLALRDKLIRLRRTEARERPGPRDYVRIATRKAELRDAIRRVIWREREAEAPEADGIWEHLDDHLDNKRQPDDWGLEPLDDHVTRLCAAFGLPLAAAATWRDLPPAPEGWAPPTDDDEDDEDELEDQPALADTG